MTAWPREKSEFFSRVGLDDFLCQCGFSNLTGAEQGAEIASIFV